MKRLFLILWAAVTLAGFFWFTDLQAQTSNNAGGSALERPIRSDESQIASWDREANIQIVLVIAIAVFGALISLFQKWNDKWAKRVTISLGLATTILTGVNTKAFSADYRALRLAASEGRAITAQLWALVAIISDPQTSLENRVANEGIFLNKLAQFQTVIDHLQGSNNNSEPQTPKSGLLILPVVYAQSAANLPTWTKTLPSDNSSLYFRGVGNDASLSEAKTKSVNDAYNKALQYLKGEAPQASDADVLSLIKTAAIVQDSAFAAGNNGYTYYTLLRLAKEIENIGLKTLPATVSLTTFKDKKWRPSDLFFGASVGLVALGGNGEVSQLVGGGPNGAQIQVLFRVPGAFQASVVTGSQDAVFVGANSPLGCTVFRYTLADKKIGQKIMGIHQHCAGIATDGNAIYLSMPDQREIARWKTWDDTSPQNWSLPDMDQPGPMVFDQIGQRLIVSGSSGKAYAVYVTDGRQQLLNSNLGAVTSISTSKLHIVFGSGKKVLFLARSDNHGENPPANLRLTGGAIVGVAVDSSDNLWFADYDNRVVEGPFSLS